MPTRLDRPPLPSDVPAAKAKPPLDPSMVWAELSILEAKRMAVEAMRIVAQSKDVCRRSNASSDKT